MHLWLARRTNNAAGVSSVVAHRGPAQRFRAACDLGTGRRLPRVTTLTLTHNLSELGHDPVCRFSACRRRVACALHMTQTASLASCCLAALSAGMPLVDAMQGSATETVNFQKVALWLWTCRWSHRHTCPGGTLGTVQARRAGRRRCPPGQRTTWGKALELDRHCAVCYTRPKTSLTGRPQRATAWSEDPPASRGRLDE